MEMEADLRTGIEEGQFAIFYQPKIELQSGEITGFEALLRWIPLRRFPLYLDCSANFTPAGARPPQVLRSLPTMTDTPGFMRCALPPMTLFINSPWIVPTPPDPLLPTQSI
jgi:EAL domain